MRRLKRYYRKADVAVLLLCAALVLSSLAAVGEQGRRRAKEAVCQANLRQWHRAFQIYRQDHDGQFFTGTSGAGYWWLTQLDEDIQSWKSNRTWFCPMAAQPIADEEGQSVGALAPFSAWGIYTDPEGISIAGSYGLNGYTIDISNRASYEGGVSADQGWRDFDNVAAAETVPLFLDALRFDLWPLPTDGPAAHEFAAWTGNHMARCAINRHTGAVNALFLDGSARRVGLKELWTLKWHRSFDTTGPWTVAGGVQPTDWPAWIRDFKDY